MSSRLLSVSLWIDLGRTACHQKSSKGWSSAHQDSQKDDAQIGKVALCRRVGMQRKKCGYYVRSKGVAKTLVPPAGQCSQWQAEACSPFPVDEPARAS